MKIKDAFIRNEYDEFININRIEKIVIERPSYSGDKWRVDGYTMSSIGSYFNGWSFDTKEEAEEFVSKILTCVEV